MAPAGEIYCSSDREDSMGARWCIAAMMLAACGSSEDSGGGDELDGEWVTGEDANGCAAGVAFDDGRFEQAVVCTLTDGSYGAAMWTGTYDAGGGDITLTVEESTCAGANARVVASYAIEGDDLTLRTSAGELYYTRLKGDSSGTGAVTYGCYANDGTFTASPLKPI